MGKFHLIPSVSQRSSGVSIIEHLEVKYKAHLTKSDIFMSDSENPALAMTMMSKCLHIDIIRNSVGFVNDALYLIGV